MTNGHSTGCGVGGSAEGDVSATAVGRVLAAAGGARVLVLPVTGLCNLLIARLITQAVGIDEFGVVMLVATLSQLLMFADLGTGAAVATARAQADGGASVTAFRAVAVTAIRTTLISSLVLACGAGVLGVTGLWPHLLGANSTQVVASINVAAVLALSTFAVALPLSVGEAILRGGGRTHEAVLLQGIAPVAALGLTLALRHADAPALAYALVFPLGALTAAVCCVGRAWRVDTSRLHGLVGGILRPRRLPGERIAATAIPMFVVMIGLPIALQSDRLIIAHRLEPADLSNYSYAAQLYLPLWSVVSLAALALWPHFAGARSRPEALRRGWSTGLAVLGGAGVVIGGFFLLFARALTAWMSDGQGSPSSSLIVAFALLLIVQSLHVTTGILLISPAQLRFQALCVTALVLCNVPLSWFSTTALGAAGPVYASVVTVGVCQLVPGVIVALRLTGRPRVSAGAGERVHA